MKTTANDPTPFAVTPTVVWPPTLPQAAIDHYIASGPNPSCPICGKDNLEDFDDANHTTHESNTVQYRRGTRCNNCNWSWFEIYELKRIQMIPRCDVYELTFADMKGQLVFREYHNNQTAITLEDINGTIAICTVALDEPHNPRCAWIKDYSENEGMLEALTRAGYVRPTGRFAHSGYVNIPEVEILIATTNKSFKSHPESR